MNLKISQILLEDLHFSHVGDFLSKEPTARAGSHHIGYEVQALDVHESNKAVVRLRIKGGGEGEQYAFSASYLILFVLEGKDEPPDLQKRLAVTGATMLMPNVRELIANITMRGRFGTVFLPAMNFAEALTETPPPAQPKAKRTPKKARAKAKG